jgi:hypothetical protein
VSTTIPSPADLARRAAQPKPGPRPAPPAAAAPQLGPLPAAEEAFAPGVLDAGAGERFKPTYHWGLILSGMRPESRLLAYTLLWYAHHRTGRIAPHLKPSREQLATATGLSTAQVGVQLEILRSRGWLRLSPVTEGPRRGQDRYDLTIPSLYLERIRAERAERRSRRRAGQTT